MNNIFIIKKFLSTDNDKKIFINQLDEGIDLLYCHIISYYTKKYQFKLKLVEDDNINLFHAEDLFGEIEIKLYKKLSLKKIDLCLDNKDKTIFFVDYKNYKKFKNIYNSINSYNYKTDIKYFLEDELKINNQILLNNITGNPEYFYSEIEKYLVNSKYENSFFNENLNDSLLINRKNLYDLKNKNTNNLVEFYDLIKKEVNIKKFSFLTS